MTRALPPIGAILCVDTAIGSTRFARLTESGLVDVDGLPLGRLEDCQAWRAVNDEERADWELYLLTSGLTAVAIDLGAPALVALLRETIMDSSHRDEQLCHVVDRLRDLGRNGLASQCAAYRFKEAM